METRELVSTISGNRELSPDAKTLERELLSLNLVMPWLLDEEQLTPCLKEAALIDLYRYLEGCFGSRLRSMLPEWSFLTAGLALWGSVTKGDCGPEIDRFQLATTNT